MALQSNFPTSPHAILKPDIRWLPSEQLIKESVYKKLLAPFVHTLRKKVYQWRGNKYEGASETSKTLLNWWFEEEHILENGGMLSYFRYYFAQREAVETIIYLYDVAQVKGHEDLLQFSNANISSQWFEENWRRFVIKMATGSGKTKVISLLLAWSYFHKTYEEHSELARNFLLIAPNIIVLDRLRSDFDGFKIFYNDPILPRNGHNGRNWQNDFQPTLHIQDEIRNVKEYGNVFLTNIHRVYSSDNIPASFDDEDTTAYFLGGKPVAKTTDSTVDLGDIVRDIDELVVINDEAHHIHDPKKAWFKSIEDIHNRLVQKDKFLSMQIDVTATPKHNNGSIFIQTIADYPLVEAIAQNIVKHPVLPDKESRKKLKEKKTSKYVEKYADFINLGVIEWKKAYDENIKLNKKSILFIMTDDTRNCDDVASYLENTYSYLKGAVLAIHTKNNGEISEAQSGKKKEELDKLREQANKIDSLESPYKAIVSVLVLKEGWDVKNVTTIVGLRAYSSKSNILPEQALGRGLRLMYRENPDAEEKVSVIGTPAFMEFVESVEKEGVKLKIEEMGDKTEPKCPIIIEVDEQNPNKDLLKLDINIPVLTPRTFRDHKDLSLLAPSKFKFTKCKLKKLEDSETREIHFKYMVKKENEEPYSHTTILDGSEIDASSALGFFANTIMKELRLVSGYHIIYGKVKEFVREQLFENPVDLEERKTVLNLSEINVTKTIIETFKKEINSLTVKEKETAELSGHHIELIKTRPFISKEKECIIPKKSIFNKIAGDNKLENEFAAFLESCDDIISYTKLYFALNFKLDYVDNEDSIRNYYPDFLVKRTDKEAFVIETKGREDLNDPLKLSRLKQWCKDINNQGFSTKWSFIFVDEESFKKYRPSNFQNLIESFTKYQ